MSLCTTWTSSWFIDVYMRSPAGLVSNARESGATSKISVPLRGGERVRVAVVGEVLEQTVVRSEGIQPNIRRCHSRALVNVRIASGAMSAR